MGWFSLLALATALAMDAFAVSMAAGALLRPVSRRQLFRLSFHFGLFQGLMPIGGYLAGLSIARFIAHWDHWIAFGLLLIIGGRMILEALRPGEDEAATTDPSRGLTLVMLALATSIDAFAVGLTLALLSVTIWIPALVIGVVTSAWCVAGVLLGARFGSICGRKVEVLGGVILVGIGIKILFSHLCA
ncbi:manganese efflux pump MntP [Desulfolithobacter dissulfuricans]|nr:manganese efflux pump MntP family protein [Desulfolithobacter dissulfuricans]